MRRRSFHLEDDRMVIRAVLSVTRCDRTVRPRNPWIVVGTDQTRDSRGKFADFHALRHMFITNLVRAKVDPKMAQTLARHSDIRLTMDIYTHMDQQEKSVAIDRLPGLGRGVVGES